MTAAPALYAATPSISINSSPSARMTDSLSELVVDESTEGLVVCEASFDNVGPGGDNHGYQLFTRDVFDFGTTLDVIAGAGQGAGSIFSGQVTGMRAEFPADGNPTMVILADDRLHTLRATRRTRMFENRTDAAVFGEIASDHRLVADIDLPGPTHRVIAQIDQSDLAFMRSRARRIGAEVWVSGDTLHVASRASRRGDPVLLSNRQNLLEASIGADLAHQHTSFTVGGWDPGTKQAIEVTADEAALASERLGGGTSAAEVLTRTFGEQPGRLVHAIPLGVDEAKSVAEAQFLGMARRFVSGDLVAAGDARLRVGARVELSGLGQWFSGHYDVVGARHVFDRIHGYRTHLSVERAEVLT